MLRTSLLAAALAAAAQAYTLGSVYLQNGAYVFKAGAYDPAAVAWGNVSDMTDHPVNGFGQLAIATNKGYNDTTQMYAAGYLEGALTQARIKQQFDNVYAWMLTQFSNGQIPAVFTQFFQTQDAWARNQIATNSSANWRVFGALLSQFDGLVAGYNSQAPGSDTLTTFQLQLLNAVGDFLDLVPALIPGAGPQWEQWDNAQVMDYVRKSTHCSALVKVNGDLTQLWTAHVAWFIYQSTDRLFKSYQFNLNDPAVFGTEMSFSSYPGYLSSLDDYYSVWSSGFTVLETTNSIFNMSLYKLVVPQSLFAWHRVRLANLMATTGADWASNFSQYNSGTYNNQYMVIETTKFVPGGALPDGLLTVVEQIPGLVVWGDATQELERGYFPSYNVPYFDVIYEQSGYTSFIESRTKNNASAWQDLSGLDYQLAPRAKIFRRDQGTVVDDATFLAIMRYNDYLNDPYAKGDPWNAICSRGDLASSPGPDGCLDGKAASASMFAAKQTYVINGPTTSHNLPPFSWSQFPSVSHEGLPAVYNYTFAVATASW